MQHHGVCNDLLFAWSLCDHCKKKHLVYIRLSGLPNWLTMTDTTDIRRFYGECSIFSSTRFCSCFFLGKRWLVRHSSPIQPGWHHFITQDSGGCPGPASWYSERICGNPPVQVESWLNVCWHLDTSEGFIPLLFNSKDVMMCLHC